MSLALPVTISSGQDLDTLRQEVREYAKWYSHNDIKQRVGSKQLVSPPQLTPAASEIFHAWTATHPLSQQSLDELSESLHKIQKSAPVITITLAAPAMGELRKHLVSWCRANIAPDALVNFQFNSTLLGGMVVRYGSHIYDWSFRRIIMDHRGKFPEVLRNV